jgi:two-component system, NarL family, nitrate/nitrite response regulator NarL
MAHGNGGSSRTADAPIQVLVIDDHEHVLWGLRKLIEGESPRMTLAGAARSIEDARQALSSLAIDVVVLDVMLGDDDGLALLPLVRQSQAAAVVLTSSRSPEVHRRALDGGACTVVLKEEPASVLLNEIELAHGWRHQPSGHAACLQDCHSAVKARIAGFLLSTTRR